MKDILQQRKVQVLLAHLFYSLYLQFYVLSLLMSQELMMKH